MKKITVDDYTSLEEGDLVYIVESSLYGHNSFYFTFPIEEKILYEVAEKTKDSVKLKGKHRNFLGKEVVLSLEPLARNFNVKIVKILPETFCFFNRKEVLPWKNKLMWFGDDGEEIAAKENIGVLSGIGDDLIYPFRTTKHTHWGFCREVFFEDLTRLTKTAKAEILSNITEDVLELLPKNILSDLFTTLTKEKFTC